MKGFNMNIWNYHDTKMQELKQLYNKASKQTQNRLQEIFDTFNFTQENIYDIATNKVKKRINTYIEQWKEQGLVLIHFHTVCPAFFVCIFLFQYLSAPFLLC